MPRDLRGRKQYIRKIVLVADNVVSSGESTVTSIDKPTGQITEVYELDVPAMGFWHKDVVRRSQSHP